jgi:hypothetical protein
MSRRIFSRTCRMPPAPGHPPRPPKSRKLPRESGGSSGEVTGQRRRRTNTTACLRRAERSCRATRGRETRRHRVRSGPGERQSGPTGARRNPANFRGSLGRAQAGPQADGGEAQPRQYFSTTRSRAAELPGPLCTRAARHGGFAQRHQRAGCRPQIFPQISNKSGDGLRRGCRPKAAAALYPIGPRRSAGA